MGKSTARELEASAAIEWGGRPRMRWPFFLFSFCFFLALPVFHFLLFDLRYPTYQHAHIGRVARGSASPPTAAIARVLFAKEAIVAAIGKQRS